jgi:ubiquinone/menaquinone biosynthesis C-methylase UbiE
MKLPDYLRCPNCCARELTFEAPSRVICGNCWANFPAQSEIRMVSLISPFMEGDLKADIQSWWADLYKQAYLGHEENIDKVKFSDQLEELEDLFRQRRHLAVVEMPVNELAGKRVLEIGSGSGAHSAMFKHHGAIITAVDITPERAAATARKLRLVSGSDSSVFNADAENLPFVDDYFDMVYSNGVLHHSTNTEQCIAEVNRVLKPGGKAVLMLYSRHSAIYWFNIVPRALFTGEMFRWPEAQWIGRLTEGKPKFGETKNPYTRVYSANEVRALLEDFNEIRLRKASFQFDNFCIPRLTQIRHGTLCLLGYEEHPGGRLVYGRAVVPDTPIELFLGNIAGFSWNIVAVK